MIRSSPLRYTLLLAIIAVFTSSLASGIVKPLNDLSIIASGTVIEPLNDAPLASGIAGLLNNIPIIPIDGLITTVDTIDALPTNTTTTTLHNPITPPPITTTNQIAQAQTLDPSQVSLTITFPRHSTKVTFSPSTIIPTKIPTNAFSIDSTLSWTYNLPPNTKLDIQLWSYTLLEASNPPKFSPSPALLSTLTDFPLSEIDLGSIIAKQEYPTVAFTLVYYDIDPLKSEPEVIQTFQSPFFSILQECYGVDPEADDYFLGTVWMFLDNCEMNEFEPFCSLQGQCTQLDTEYLASQRRAKCRLCPPLGTRSCDEFGDCICKEGYGGYKCTQPVKCHSDRDLLCDNPLFGYVPLLQDGNCDTKCTCLHGLFGLKCACPLVCPSGSEPNDDCSSCKCPVERSGKTCECWGLFADVIIPFTNHVLVQNGGYFPTPETVDTWETELFVFDISTLQPIQPTFQLNTVTLNQLDFHSLGLWFVDKILNTSSSLLYQTPTSFTMSPTFTFSETDIHHLYPIPSTIFKFRLLVGCLDANGLTIDKFEQFVLDFPFDPFSSDFSPLSVISSADDFDFDRRTIKWILSPAEPLIPLPQPNIPIERSNLGTFTLSTLLGNYQLDLISTPLYILADGEIQPDFTYQGTPIVQSELSKLSKRAISSDALTSWKFIPLSSSFAQLLSFSIEVWSYPILTSDFTVSSPQPFSTIPILLHIIKSEADSTTFSQDLVSLLGEGDISIHTYTVIRVVYTYQIDIIDTPNSSKTKIIKLLSQGIPFSIQPLCLQPALLPSQFGSHPFIEHCSNGNSSSTCTVTGQCRPKDEIAPKNQASPCSQCDQTNTTRCSEDDGICHCYNGWEGRTCLQPTGCSSIVDQVCVDPIVGFVQNVFLDDQQQCQSNCTCIGHFSGYKCHICDLVCQNNGKPYNDCNRCGCSAGYGGDRCQCQLATASIQLFGTNDVISASKGRFTTTPLLLLPLQINADTANWDNYSPVGMNEVDFQFYRIMSELYTEFELFFKNPLSFTITPNDSISTTFTFTIKYDCDESIPELTSLEDFSTVWESFQTNFHQFESILNNFKHLIVVDHEESTSLANNSSFFSLGDRYYHENEEKASTMIMDLQQQAQKVVTFASIPPVQHTILTQSPASLPTGDDAYIPYPPIYPSGNKVAWHIPVIVASICFLFILVITCILVMKFCLGIDTINQIIPCIRQSDSNNNSNNNNKASPDDAEIDIELATSPPTIVPSDTTTTLDLTATDAFSSSPSLITSIPLERTHPSDNDTQNEDDDCQSPSAGDLDWGDDRDLLELGDCIAVDDPNTGVNDGSSKAHTAPTDQYPPFPETEPYLSPENLTDHNNDLYHTDQSDGDYSPDGDIDWGDDADLFDF